MFEHKLHQVVSYLILPLFALCNAAIVIPTQKLTQTFSHPVFWAITFGLFLGKPIGIFFFSYGSAKLKLAEFPKQATWQATLAASSLAGIGFTMSLFMTELSFVDLSSREIAKLGILSGSLLSAMMGSLLFLWIKKPLPNITHILESK